MNTPKAILAIMWGIGLYLVTRTNYKNRYAKVRFIIGAGIFLGSSLIMSIQENAGG